MRKSFAFFLLCLAGFETVSQAADDLASSIIHSEVTPIYNAHDNTEDELNKQAASVAQERLKQLLLNDSSEEIRVCFALRILEPQIGIARKLAADPSDDGRGKRYPEGLLQKHAKLVRQFRAISEKKPQGDASKLSR